MAEDQGTHDDIMRSLGRLEGKIDGILEQATKTNGRVTKLEADVTALKVTEGVTTTKLSIIGIVAGALGGWVLSLFK